MIHSTDIPDPRKAGLQTLMDPLLEQKKIRIDVLRLDKIHTIVSGNKWFKLKYYLKTAIEEGKKGIISLGGPYSNHLVAMAYACRQAGLASIGVIRGEEPEAYGPSLKDMQAYGMLLRFFSRQFYNDRRLLEELRETHPQLLMVDEGGRGSLGIKGAEEILHLVPSQVYTHIVCAVGTGTMMTGIIKATSGTQQVIGILSLKSNDSNYRQILDFIQTNSFSDNFLLLNNFHFGGYARKTKELIHFMNNFYRQHTIPSDFVYTGKLFFAAMKLAQENYFMPGAHILIIHSGGLQGNRSLAKGTLDYQY